jgi:hypothetical protein
MIDEMRAAEDLVRHLAAPGQPVPIPEPLALDESAWFVTAVDKGLVEFTRCDPACPSATDERRHDHFETDDGCSHHLFAREPGGELTLNRDYVTVVAAFARAVLALGYDGDQGSLLRTYPVGHRLAQLWSGTTTVRSDGEFRADDGAIHLEVLGAKSRQATRRLATAIDANGRLSAMPEDVARRFRVVMERRPRYLWLVGPNAVEPDRHVFRVSFTEHDAVFHRVDELPAPA